MCLCGYAVMRLGIFVFASDQKARGDLYLQPLFLKISHPSFTIYIICIIYCSLQW